MNCASLRRTRAERFTWAVGLYKFKEEQGVFLGIPLDYSTDLAYLEFNQGSTIGESESAYADLTFALDRPAAHHRGRALLGRKQGARGLQLHRRLQHQRCGDARRHAGLPHDRAQPHHQEIRTPTATACATRSTTWSCCTRPASPRSASTTRWTSSSPAAAWTSSEFQGTCAGYPGLGVAFGGATVQCGENSDSYVDWRFRIGYELTDDNLLYFLVATGNKAPSFNDTVDLDTGPAERSVHATGRSGKEHDVRNGF